MGLLIVMDSIDVTFFIPCLNCEKMIIDTIVSIREAMKEYDYSYEILIFDDHSKDNSAVCVETYIENNLDTSITLIRNEKSFGIGHNFVEGAVRGNGTYYKMVHAGNIERKEGTKAFIDSLGDADIITSYIIDDRGKFRRLFSSFYTYVVSLVSGYSLQYYQGSALYSRKDILIFHPYNSGNGFLAELLTILMNNGRTVKEIEIEQIRTVSGSKSLSGRNFISVLQGLINIICRRILR